MKERIMTTIVIIGIFWGIANIPVNINCEFCGENFNRNNSEIEEICDICYGWNEHKASLTENGIQLKFSNGGGYYFQGK